MLKHIQQQAIVARLNRIEGQVRGIRRMVEQPRQCIEILQQLAAAEAALDRISHTILTFHVEDCVPQAVAEGGHEQQLRLKELADIVGRFAR